MNEHAKLARDAFNTFALGCAGYAAFNESAEPLARAIFALVGVHCHVIAHLVIAYGKLPVDRQEARHA